MKLLDVSKWQSPAAVNYERARELGYVGVICRATYGIRPDETFDDHVIKARAAGLKIGCYHFFRQTQDATAQARAFHDTVSAVGYGAGDILPALDLEANTDYDGKPDATLYNRSRVIADAWAARYGSLLLYFSPAFWTEMGRPAWWLEHPIWIAHYRVTVPAVPKGAPWSIWQHKVEPLPGVYTDGKIDQNEVPGALPLITRAPPAPELTIDDVASGYIPLAVDVEAQRRDRDEYIRATEAEPDGRIPSTGTGDQSGSEASAGGAGGTGTGGGSLARGTADGEAAQGNDHATSTVTETESGLATMTTANEKLAAAAEAALKDGPLGNKTARGDDYEAFVGSAFGSGKELRSKATSCAIFVGACKFHAGLSPKRNWPKPGICTWAGVSWFDKKRDWIPNDGSLVLQRGDIVYWSGSPGDTVVEDDLNGHVGILVSGDGHTWITAEGGGGADGTECRMSKAPKDVRMHGTRPLRGVWRPNGVGSSVTPIRPQAPKPAPAPSDPVKMWQTELAALGLYRGKVDGDFGRKTLAASIALLPRDAA